MNPSSRRRAVVLPLATLTVLASAAVARAADPTTPECIAANDAAARHRAEGKLLDARDALVTCASPSCPVNVRAECEKGLDDVKHSLPTIVFEPKDPAGNDVLTPVRVEMDGKPLVDRLDGRAVSVDPGPHEFSFESAGAAPAKRTLMVHEAEKDRREVVVLASAPPAPVPAPIPVSPAAAEPPSSPVATRVADRPASAGPPEHGTTPSGLEVQLASGYMLPLGSIDGASGDDLNKFVSGGVPLRIDLGYRFLRPSIFVGGYFAYAFGSVAGGSGTAGETLGCGTGSIGCSATDLLYGVDAQIHFLPETSFDPWVGVGFGFENSTITASNGAVSGSLGVTGLDFFTLMLGGDYKVAPNLGIGPYFDFSLGQYNGSSTSVTGQATQSQSITNTAMHEWLTLGVRGAYDVNVGH